MDSLGENHDPHVIDEGNLFLVTDIHEGASEQEAIEDIQLHWLPFQDALQLVDDGVITGWMSQITLLKADRYRGLKR